MLEDWRFRDSPYVEQGGLTAYAGVPLRMQHESGESVGLGSLCVASSVPQDPLSKHQQQTLARLADWVVADMVQCTRARRQLERHRFTELVAAAQQDIDNAEFEDIILGTLRAAYPDDLTSLELSRADQVDAMKEYSALSSTPENGLWEDTAYIDEIITKSNQYDPPVEKVVRYIFAPCDSRIGPSALIVATKNFRQVFDDVDLWFLQTCATMVSQNWQKRLLSEVMRAKENFLRGMSHQLRTPIHGILGAAELLSEDLQKFFSLDDALRPEVAELLKPMIHLGQSSSYLETISTAGRDLMATVNSLITLNRWADVAVAERNYANICINELEAELMKEMIQTTSGDTNVMPSIFMHNEVPPECGTIRIDLSLLRDSVVPLINNAIQNTSKGMVTVSVSMEPQSNVFVIDVRDTGCGIAVKDQKRIFELYEKVGEHSIGAGLGLTLATKFSALLHGSVELVSSRVDHGSHFRATYRDVACPLTLPPLQPTLCKLKYLGTRFHHLAFDSTDTPLSVNLSRFLARNGFTRTDSLEDCLLILDYVPDLNQRQIYYSRLPMNQVAICLVPASEEYKALESTHSVVHVSGPFWSLTLSRALEEADEMLAETSAKSSLTQESKSSLHPKDRFALVETLSLDDGYSSADSSNSFSNSSLSSTASPDHIRISTAEPYLELSVSPTRQAETAISLVTRPSPFIRSLSSSIRPEKPMALLVDDNVVNLRIMEMYCKRRGLPYHSATDGNQAVDAFLRARKMSGDGAGIELVLMDLQMPVCDGIKATEQIRLLEKQNRWDPSFLVIVTGQDSQVDRHATSTAGADDYLVKPIGMRLLDQTLGKIFPAMMAC